MHPSIKMQTDMRNNATVLEDYARELNAWENEMKEKDKFLKKTSSNQPQDLPPPRSKRISKPVTQVSKKCSSTDYDKWSKFDVEKACEEVDYSTETESSEDDEQAIEKSKELKNEGNTYVKKCDWVKALECYTKAINLYQGDAIYYANRALCYIKLEKWTKAEKDCCTALDIDPKYVKALQRRSVARAALGKLVLAANDMSEVIKLEPNNKEAKEHLKELNNKLSCIRNNNKDNRTEKKIVEVANTDTDKKSDKDNPYKWFETVSDSKAIVEPIFKAPHERSQKPIRRINVEEIDPSAPTKRSINTLSNVSIASDSKIKQPDSPKRTIANTDVNRTFTKQENDEIKMDEKTKANINKKESEEVKIDVAKNNIILDIKLEEPKTSIHFYNTWKQLKGNLGKRYEYLKMIPGESFKKLFGNSLESHILSEILEVLSTKFISNRNPVISYLEGIKNVPRFSALRMFMSANDQLAIKELLIHSKKLSEINDKEMEDLMKTYEIKG